MILNLEWLKNVLDTKKDIYEIATKLNEIGIEVENKILSKKNFEKIVVAEILDCKNHPDSDHLHVCDVSDGKETYQIVCGAPNARTGIKVALALVGAYIPYGDFKIKKSKIRGIYSCGMMCSEREMCLGKEHDGIMELPNDCKVGSLWFDEYHVSEKMPIELSITPNRGDAASIYGIARDLSASGFGTLKEIESVSLEETIKNTHTVDVKINNCMYFCREIRNIKNINAKTPNFILKRNALNGCGDNGIIVNILNYIMFTYGQPMHSYDADKIGKNIIIDYAKNDTFLTLKEDEIKFNKDKILAVSDENKDLCIAGIIGGNDCKTTSETKNILLESAYFPTEQITIGGQELKITSDARFRYERGINPYLTAKMLDIATKMIVDLCGGEISNTVSDGKIDNEKVVTYPFSLTKKILGFEISNERTVEILEKLQFEILDRNDFELKIKIPSFRHDIEIKEDIAEELVRIEGLHNVPYKRYVFSGSYKQNLFKENLKAKKFLAASGLKECITFSFCDASKAELFTSINEDLLLVNPIADDLNYMRPNLLIGLLDVIAKNESQILDNQLAFFEEGMIFTSADKQGQHNSIAGVYSGSAIKNDWFKENRKFDIFDAKKDLFELLKQVKGLNIKNIKLVKCKENYTHPTRSYDVQIKIADHDNTIARFGEISPLILSKFKIKNPVCFFELFDTTIQQTKKKQFVENSLQPIVRDIAFIVDDSVPIEQLLNAYKDNIIKDVKVVDLFKIKDTKTKSVALRYIFQPVTSITTEQINDYMKDIIKAVEQKTHGKVRDGK